ncbi:MAG TPA: YchJ family metal-binding protein [Phycicoccus sp.]|nr:YchJ family metal-binding protein [Phycicoccus sp.]HQY97271.1 YchJ family metal-binding protein [Phycicoccus sp.]HRA44318.1 YchJ family metal-binding protein [Phycicoccus sp.]
MVSAFGGGGALGVGAHVDPDRCPCRPGDDMAYAVCCRPLLLGESRAETAEALMRSRYTAYALGDLAHLQRTWHPRTLPLGLVLDPQLRWTGLTVVSSVDGGAADSEGIVAFEARWESGLGESLQRGVLRETSAFTRRAGRWVYVGPTEDG